MTAGADPQHAGALGTRRIEQISIVVEDIERAAGAWAAVLGLPVPRASTPDLAESEQRELRYRGEPMNAGARTAFFYMDNVDIELLEPVEGPSTWSDFLDGRLERGLRGGGHHIAFVVDDAPSRLASLEAAGYPTPQTGIRRVGPRYGYADATESLGAFLELLGGPDAGNAQRNAEAAAEVRRTREAARASTHALPASGPLGTRRVAQVALTVADAVDAAGRLDALLGGRATPVFERTGADFRWVRLLGRPVDGALRGALVPTEDEVVIEVLEPVGGPSTWHEQLTALGPSMHHIAFEVPDAAAAMSGLRELGYGELQAGESPRGIYAYADTRDALGIYVEILEPTRT